MVSFLSQFPSFFLYYFSNWVIASCSFAPVDTHLKPIAWPEGSTLKHWGPNSSSIPTIVVFTQNGLKPAYWEKCWRLWPSFVARTWTGISYPLVNLNLAAVFLSHYTTYLASFMLPTRTAPLLSLILKMLVTESGTINLSGIFFYVHTTTQSFPLTAIDV